MADRSRCGRCAIHTSCVRCRKKTCSSIRRRSTIRGWSARRIRGRAAIGAACLALVLLTSVLAPSAATTLAGYKLESLRAEERRLLNERRVLELQEAEMLSPQRLEKLATDQNLVTPASGQTVRLDPKGDGKVATNRGLGARD